MTPIRIQRSRQHKQVSPNGLPIVYCGRGSKWGNPFRVVKCMDKWGVRISDATDQRQIDISLEVCKGFYSTKEEAAKHAVTCYIKYSHPYEHGGSMQDLIISCAFVDEAIESLAGKTLQLSRNKENEGKKRPICACGTEMTFIVYKAYYDEFFYWTCENPDCKAEDQFKPDREDKGAWT